MTTPTSIPAGTTVKYRRPENDREAAMRFRVVESYDGRAHIAIIGWTHGAITPISTVSVDELERVD